MTITFRKMTSPVEIAEFWCKKQEYDERDIFPALSAEAVTWFKSTMYYDTIMALHSEPPMKGAGLQFIFIYDGLEYIGFTTYKTYLYEDGKTMILDYCIEPSKRNKGIGSLVFKKLEQCLKGEGSCYIELNSGEEGEPDGRFWERQGFIPKERDEHGVMIYVKKDR